MRPETVVRWHRQGYRYWWRHRSRPRGGRPRIPHAHIDFIRQISTEHPEWGEDRIALEMRLKFGVVLSRVLGAHRSRSMVLHDNDGIFGQLGKNRGVGGRSLRSSLDVWLAVERMARGIATPYRAPNANAVIERYMGTLRRECLNH